jgi:hypothetical protein
VAAIYGRVNVSSRASVGNDRIAREPQQPVLMDVAAEASGASASPNRPEASEMRACSVGAWRSRRLRKPGETSATLPRPHQHHGQLR